MSGKVEEVARAIATANGDDGMFKAFLPHARAAIEAMGEPTDGMLDAAKPFGICMSALDDAYRTMIDAALREEGR